jgi:hypothetical protein
MLSVVLTSVPSVTVFSALKVIDMGSSIKYFNLVGFSSYFFTTVSLNISYDKLEPLFVITGFFLIGE